MMKLTDGFLQAISALVKDNGAIDYAVLTLEPAGIARAQTARAIKKPLLSHTDRAIDLDKLADAIKTLDTPPSSCSVLITMLTDAKQDVLLNDGLPAIESGFAEESNEDVSFQEHGRETFKEACVRMWKAGMNLDDIAAAMGVSALTISIALRNQLKEAG
ncbi:MAG: hypothetical protein AB3N20_14505 [Rhizobiaceae bacterium]